MLPDLQKKLTAFELQAEISKTDISMTYLAHRVSDGIPVLLSILNPKYTYDAYFTRLFHDMGERHMRLEHPHILKQIDTVADNGLLYTVFEFPGGELLSDYLANSLPVPAPAAILLIQQLATAIDYAHSQGVRHGNISDDTILIHQDQVYLLQFGLSKLLKDVAHANLADPRFLSPERLRGESSTRSADLYALGVLTYLILTGEYPFPTADDSMHRIPIVPPHTRRAAIRPAVSEVILRMLSSGVELRHSTGAEFARAVQVAFEGSAPLRPITAATMAIKPPKRPTAVALSPRWVLRGGVAFILAVVTLAAGFWIVTRWNDLTQAFAPSARPTATLPAPTPTARPTVDAVKPLPSPTTAPTFPPPTLPPATPHLRATATPGRDTGVSPSDNGVFSQLVLANGITDEFKPINATTVFSPTTKTVYLFFHYDGIAPNTPWQVEWQYDGSTIQLGTDVWSPDYGAVGTAWVFYAPIDGFNIGRYSVTLSVDGNIVANTEFDVQ